MKFWTYFVLLIEFSLKTNVAADDSCVFKTPEDPLLQCLEVGQSKYTIRKCETGPVHYENGTQLAFHCVEKGQLRGNFERKCLNGEWTDNAQTVCQKTCPKLIYNPIKTKITCNDTKCEERQTIGTTIQITCSSDYERPKPLKYTEIHCNNDGTWSNPIYDCINVHIDIKNVLPLNTGGEETQINKVPYHAALFQRKKTKVFHKCGATIISQQALVTAAHCFYKNTIRLDNKNFFIIAGKFHRKFDTIDPNTQESEISEVYIHDSYKNQDLFRDDLALVILETPLRYTPVVQKVEVDLDFNHFTEGQVSGWGLDENQMILATLHTTKLDVIECVGQQNLSEKFCAGGAGKAVCQGDSGGGFIVQKDGVNFVVGVVSTSLDTIGEGCNPDTPARFNRLSPYLNLFQKAKRYLLLLQTCEDYKFKCSSGACINIEQVCDGINDCDDDELSINCNRLSEQKMMQMGVNLLQSSKFYENRYPNWLIPTGALWIMANFLSQVVRNETIRSQIAFDFRIGIIDKGDEILENIQNLTIYQSQFFHTRDEIRVLDDTLAKKYLINVKARRKGPPEFFYPELFRIGVHLNADYSYTIKEIPVNLTFLSSSDEVQVPMYCFSNRKTEVSFIKELDADTVSIPLKDSIIKLYAFVPKNSIETTLKALKSYNFHLIEEKLLGNTRDTCIPEFKILTSIDYTPVFYKFGYDYMFNLDPVELSIVDRKAHFQTNIRGFFGIYEDENYKRPSSSVQSSIEQKYVINKPFIFVVREEITKSVLFMGKVLEPHKYSRYVNAYTKCKIFSETQCNDN